MTSLESYDPEDLNRGTIIAEYHHRRSTQILFMLFFVGLFCLGLDVIFFRQLIPNPDLKVKLAAVADMGLSLGFLAFLVRRVLRKAQVIVTDKGLQLDISEFKIKTIFVPWESVMAVKISTVRIQLFWKLKFLVVTVTPGFPIPKRTHPYLKLSENQLFIDLNSLTIKPEALIAELSDYKKRFSRG